MVTKVTAYILSRFDGEPRLLVFAHRAFPDVPLQTPAGTVEPGEDLEAAARREILEESGLADVRLVRKLGNRHFFRTDLNDLEDRHFFLYELEHSAPSTWDHCVGGGGEDNGLVFSYFWLPKGRIPEVEPLLAPFLTEGAVPELFAG